MDRHLLSRAQSLTRSIGSHSTRISQLADKRTVTIQVLREQGASWAELSRHLDMSPQAVSKIAGRKAPQ